MVVWVWDFTKVGLCTQLCTVTGLILRSKLHYFAQSVTVQICTSPLETTWLSSLYLTSWTYIFDSYSLEILLDFGKRVFFRKAKALEEISRQGPPNRRHLDWGGAPPILPADRGNRTGSQSTTGKKNRGPVQKNIF
jgi:hypothetical protein